MEFGSTEWLEQLAKNGRFPSVYAFFVTADKNVTAREVMQSDGGVLEDIKSIEFGVIQEELTDNQYRTALVEIKKCNSLEDYYNEMIRIKANWFN